MCDMQCKIILKLCHVIHSRVLVTHFIVISLPLEGIQKGNPHTIQISRVTLTTNPQYITILDVNETKIFRNDGCTAL